MLAGQRICLQRAGKLWKTSWKMAENLVNLGYLRDYRLDLLEDLRDIDADFDITLSALVRASSNLNTFDLQQEVREFLSILDVYKKFWASLNSTGRNQLFRKKNSRAIIHFLRNIRICMTKRNLENYAHFSSLYYYCALNYYSELKSSRLHHCSFRTDFKVELRLQNTFDIYFRKISIARFVLNLSRWFLVQTKVNKWSFGNCVQKYLIF